MSSNVLAIPDIRQKSIFIDNLKRFLTGLLGEEKPSSMLILLSILVLSLHLWGIIWLLQPKEPESSRSLALPMEVSMIVISAPKPSATPPTMTTSPAENKPTPMIPKSKPKKIAPIAHKSPKVAPVEKALEPKLENLETTQSSANNNSKPSANTTDEDFTEANYKADYLHNPKPEYPLLANNRGWQGKVFLRVKVSASGLSDEVSVDRSSGHDILDDAAIDAVKQWRFIPARHGNTGITSSVIVPIVFSLHEE